MNNFKSVLGDAAGGALCQMLSTYGAAAPLLTAISLIEPTPFGEAVATSSMLAGYAAFYGCTWDPDQDGPQGPSTITGCKKVSDGGQLKINHRPNCANASGQLVGTGLEIISAGFEVRPDDEWFVIRWRSLGGSEQVTEYRAEVGRTNCAVGTVNVGTCAELPPTPPPPNPDPYIHTDPDSGCELSVQFLGYGLGPSDTLNGIWEISPVLPPATQSTRAGGGVIGGCNFSPVIYIDDGNGGDGGGRYFTIPDPVPPDGEEPWWAPFARGLAQGVAAAATQALIDQLFTTKYGGGSYELKGVCELDPDGNPMDVTRSVNFPEATSPDAILFRLDALADMFQFAKDLRQPTCRESGQPITGDAVTVNFRSDGVSPDSGRQVRKRFVYFDQVNSTLEDTVNHWRNFTWQAGPVIVNCLGTKLGKPQVWAASLDEAKRVFAHAAAIAGVDLTGAEYPVMTPKSSRYGVTGLMRVHRDKRGTLGVTKRDGPSGFPEGLS